MTFNTFPWKDEDDKFLILLNLIFDNIDKKDAWLRGNCLCHAALEGNLKIYQVLSKNLEDQNTSISDNTPLHFAIRSGNFELCQFIAKNTHNLEQLDTAARTPLQLAKEMKNRKISQLLKNCIEDLRYQSSKPKKRRQTF